MKNFFIDRRRGLFGTILFHLVLAIIVIIFGFTTPLPLPEEEGILINFGTDEYGSGLIEPSFASAPEEITPSDPEAASVPETQTAADAEELLAQEFEDAPEVKAVPVKDPEQEKKEREAREAERRRLEELERQRQAELERQRLAELERQRKEEEQRRIDEIQNRTRDAFANARNTADNTSRGEGDTVGQGNQGSRDGAVDSDNRTGGPGGSGDKGISFDLAGRSPLFLPEPEYNYQEEGIVVVEVTVDRNGNVTNAIPGTKGSSTLNAYLNASAKKAALAAKFDRKPDAPAFQKGTITYHFLLQ